MPHPWYGSFRGYVVFHARQPVAGGEFEVSVVAVFERGMYLYWRFIPDIPALQTMFREELRQQRIQRIMRIKQRPDVFSEDELTDPRYRFLDEVAVSEGMVRQSLRFGDDIGTHYRKAGEGFGSSAMHFVDVRGNAGYTPTLPETASQLWVSAVGVTLTANLTDQR